MAVEKDEKLGIEIEEDQYFRKPGIFLVWLGEDVRDDAFYLATYLRKFHLVEIDLDAGSLKSQLRQADKLRLSHALILGERELSEKKCAVKDLSTGEQESVNLSNLNRTLFKTLNLNAREIKDRSWQEWDYRKLPSFRGMIL